MTGNRTPSADRPKARCYLFAVIGLQRTAPQTFLI